jgi:hypothetical protein
LYQYLLDRFQHHDQHFATTTAIERLPVVCIKLRKVQEEMKRREKLLLDAIGELSDTPTTWDATAKWQIKKDTAQADFDEATAAFKLHRDLESKYSRAVYRPWMLVSEPTP